MVPTSQCKQGDVTASWNNDGSVAAAAASDGAPGIKLKNKTINQRRWCWQAKCMQGNATALGTMVVQCKAMRQHQAQWWWLCNSSCHAACFGIPRKENALKDNN